MTLKGSMTMKCSQEDKKTTKRPLQETRYALKLGANYEKKTTINFTALFTSIF